MIVGWTATEKDSFRILDAFLDAGFNFLLKHHYFTYPAIAVGLGLVLEWLSEKNFASRVILALLVVSIVWMGSQEALTVARGGV